MADFMDSDPGLEFGNDIYKVVPDHLWKLFPPSGQYLKNILIFCGYEHRESILRLKDLGELKKMFKFVQENQELIADKASMFGIFTQNPELLTILPGLEPIFKEFLLRVDSLVPKKIESSQTRQSFSKAHTVSHGLEEGNKAARFPNADDLANRLKRWLEKEMKIKNKNFSIDDLSITFTIQSAFNNNFIFTCKQAECQVKLVLPFSKRCNSVVLSNAQRHISRRCWLNGRKNRAPIFSVPTTVSTFFSSQTQISTKNDSLNTGSPDYVNLNLSKRSFASSQKDMGFSCKQEESFADDFQPTASATESEGHDIHKRKIQEVSCQNKSSSLGIKRNPSSRNPLQLVAWDRGGKPLVMSDEELSDTSNQSSLVKSPLFRY